MAGHSKWANIKHRKGKQDALKGKIFTKMIRAITVAAKKGGSDISANSNLKLAVDKALSSNMSRDTIDRAIKRGCGGDDASNVEEIVYEGYGPSGIAIIVECLSDNRNRTIAEIRHAFTKHGGNLGGSSVAYLFKKQGLITFAPGSNENKIMEIALESGAEDVTTYEDGSIEVITLPEKFVILKDIFTDKKIPFENAEIVMTASNQITLDQENAHKIIKLTDALEDLEDVQNVYTNADIKSEFWDSYTK